MTISFYFIVFQKSKCINASCHHALCHVIIMNPMIHIHFINKSGKFFQNHMDKSIPCFWVYGCCKVVMNISKNINTLFIGKWYIGIFEIDT
jgi:hypothetical protein